MTKAQIRDEIQGARSFLAGCGIPASDVVGMRAPYLETKPEVRQILHSKDFLYDRCDCERRQQLAGKDAVRVGGSRAMRQGRQSSCNLLCHAMCDLQILQSAACYRARC